MGVFDDKKFEQLDWMSQITEGIESEINGLLARLPDRVELDYDSVISFMESGYDSPSLSVGSVVRKFIKNLDLTASWEDQNTLESCFKLEVSEGTEFDMENKTMLGSIAVVKTITTIPDEVLQRQMGAEGFRELSRVSWHNEGVMPRAHEIMELLGGMEAHMKGRSTRRKHLAIRERLIAILRNNEWRIRDTELADKVVIWVAQYISNGNLAAFSNFCKVKVMTHQGGPIYSIEEQQ